MKRFHLIAPQTPLEGDAYINVPLKLTLRGDSSLVLVDNGHVPASLKNGAGPSRLVPLDPKEDRAEPVHVIAVLCDVDLTQLDAALSGLAGEPDVSSALLWKTLMHLAPDQVKKLKLESADLEAAVNVVVDGMSVEDARKLLVMAKGGGKKLTKAELDADVSGIANKLRMLCETDPVLFMELTGQPRAYRDDLVELLSEVSGAMIADKAVIREGAGE